jgi:hypothetical protein
VPVLKIEIEIENQSSTALVATGSFGGGCEVCFPRILSYLNRYEQTHPRTGAWLSI